MRVHHLVASTIDHVALLISDSFALNKPQRRFQFEAMWTRRDECRDIIKEAWIGSVRVDNPCDIVAGLKSCVDDLSKWNRAVFGNVPRLITDNVLVAFEMMHYLEHKKEGKDSSMAIKLDMSKAYDKVEWDFIEQVMRTLGFYERWIGLIMRCITIVSYSVFINGVAHSNIMPSRGLRQGDPLSSYLFLLCADGFSSLINKAIRSQAMSGLSICRGSPMISHLFFTDDSLLFCKASSQECQQLIDILWLYEAASGPKVNTNKSSVFFSANTLGELKIETLDILGPMQDSWHSKYLGLPSIIKKSKMDVFAEIKERVERKLSGWKEKILSFGGREILIKAVGQAIPTYTMSCFQLPKGLCDEIEMRRFWWGQQGQESKIAWVSWRKLCISKLKGGMGFRNLQAFNLAMLAKQSWRLLENPNSLVAQTYRTKYYPHGDAFNAGLGSSPSFLGEA
ncbi:uncharacterized protein LOC136067411 [Quercus suber]|uniref:uncharacterized protein LOC136067411 n=1 Tax=Quercus suber TaxID=58331 RepID=UPI0032DEEA0D